MRKKIIFLLLFLIFPVSGITQAAPAALETDPSVSSGVLDCGLSYYLVTNESRAGMADFALVRKISPESAEDRNAETVFARTCLDSLPHFMHRSPLSFLAGNGVAYPRDGYVKVEKDAVLYHFRDVFMKRTAGLVDSIAGGGGIISLPAYMLAGVPAHSALGTNKMGSTMGTIVSTARLAKN